MTIDFILKKNYFNKFKKLFMEIKSNIIEIKNIAIDNILSYEIFSVDFLEIFEEIKIEVYNIKNLKSGLLDIEELIINIEKDINYELN